MGYRTLARTRTRAIRFLSAAFWPGLPGAAGIKALPNIRTTNGAQVPKYNCSTRNTRDQEQGRALADTATEWAQHRQLVQAIMDKVVALLERMDRTTPPGDYSLRRILVETGVTLDMIRARVAHQAFAGRPPDAYWPPMRAPLDTFATDLGMLVCGPLERAPAYARFWEPETRALLRDVGRGQDTPYRRGNLPLSPPRTCQPTV